MSWNVEYTDEFEEWWRGLTEDEQEDFTAVVTLLTEHGPQLPRNTAGDRQPPTHRQLQRGHAR